ncbi:MAG: glycosyltransferase family 4 protein [Ilumatobacter sp.]|nr:glycosyltransferase family 4 protein [Ilumatobacter sp.]
MRVLMSSWDFPPKETGGTAAHVAGLSHALAEAGHDVVVLTVAHPGADREAERTGPVRVVRGVTDLPWLPKTEPVSRTASANHALVKLGARLPELLEGWQPDVVHGHDWRMGWTADTVASLFDVPFVLTMHGTERVRHGGELPPGTPSDINSIEWWLAFQADRLISPTKFMVDQLVTGFELPPELVARVPNGIDPDLWKAPDDEPVEREPFVLSWGRVQFEKGFQVLARAMTAVRGRVPGVHCTIAGRGSYLPELQSQLDVEGVSDIIDLPGFVNDTELRRLTQRAGCVVIPSLYEPFGLVALEALAAGAPLVVARTGGLAELIEGTDAGLTFEPGRPRDLASCIERVLNDQFLAEELMRNARELIERKYSWQAIAASTARVYQAARTARAG